jgi:hypothetical protein
MLSAALHPEGGTVEDFDQRYQQLLQQADQVQAAWARSQQQAHQARQDQVQQVIQHVRGRLAQAAAQSSERLTYVQREVRDGEGQPSLRHLLEWTRPYPPRQLVIALDESEGLLRWGWGWWAADPQTPSGGVFQADLQEAVPFALVTPAALDQLVLRLADQSQWQGEQPPSGSLLPLAPSS